MVAIEANSRLGQGIEVGGMRVKPAAITAQFDPHVVRHEEQDVGSPSGWPGALPERGRTQEPAPRQRALLLVKTMMTPSGSVTETVVGVVFTSRPRLFKSAAARWRSGTVKNRPGLVLSPAGSSFTSSPDPPGRRK